MLTEAPERAPGAASRRLPATRCRVIAADGSVRPLRVSGEGRNLDGGQDVTVGQRRRPLRDTRDGRRAERRSRLRLARLPARRPKRPAAVTKTIAAVRANLRSVPGFTGFATAGRCARRATGPGRATSTAFAKFFYVITVLALLSALVLISNTMTTLVAEQTVEIGDDEGDRRPAPADRRSSTSRRRCCSARSEPSSASPSGIVLSNLLVRYFGSTFFAIDIGFGVDARVLALSVARRSARAAARRAAGDPASSAGRRCARRSRRPARRSGGQDAGDRLLRRVRFLPRTAADRPAQRRPAQAAQPRDGADGRARRRKPARRARPRRGISQTSHASWRDHGEDVKMTSIGSRPLDARAGA